MYLFQVMSRESLEDLQKKQAEMEQNNQNPWTFKQIAHGNMLGIRKVLSPFDLHNHGRFAGKFHIPGRVWQAWGTEINIYCHTVTPSRPSNHYRSKQHFERLWLSVISGNLLWGFFLRKCICEFCHFVKGIFFPFSEWKTNKLDYVFDFGMVGQVKYK